VEGIDVEPYHPMGRSKADKIGRESSLPHLGFVEPEVCQAWIDEIQRQTRVPVCRG